jgi:DNA-binding NarL/FixJ family response regulator
VIAVAVLAPTPMARARLEALISRRPGLRLISAPGRASLEGADVLVVDPGDRPIEAVMRVVRGAARVPPIVLVGVGPGSPARLLRAGMRGLLPREASEREVLTCLEAVASGLIVMHPAVAPAAMARATGRRRPTDGSAPEPLTSRELEVLTMMAEGLGNRAIASALGITTHTVKFHVAAVLEKLHARRRTDAVAIAMRLGILLI